MILTVFAHCDLCSISSVSSDTLFLYNNQIFFYNFTITFTFDNAREQLAVDGYRESAQIMWIFSEDLA